MPIEVELFGGLAPGQPRKQQLEPDRPVSAAEVAALLDLAPSLIGLITINGLQSELEDGVPAGGRICFFPYLSGG
jgi:hypothetical protein